MAPEASRITSLERLSLASSINEHSGKIFPEVYEVKLTQETPGAFEFVFCLNKWADGGPWIAYLYYLHKK